MLHIQYHNVLFIYNDIKLCRYIKHTYYFQIWTLGKKMKLRNPVSTQTKSMPILGFLIHSTLMYCPLFVGRGHVDPPWTPIRDWVLTDSLYFLTWFTHMKTDTKEICGSPLKLQVWRKHHTNSNRFFFNGFSTSKKSNLKAQETLRNWSGVRGFRES